MTLTSKVMLGVYGCVPGFDQNVKTALTKLQNGSSTKFKLKKSALAEWVDENQEVDSLIKAELSRHLNYTYMRILDDFLWNFNKFEEQK